MNTRSSHRIFIFFLLTTIVSSVGAEPVSSILQKASVLVGNPYRTGGIAPGGFDCSGFVSYLYRPTLPELPRVSRNMANTGEAVDVGQWRPGDLLFYATGADSSRINHVALWYGDGTIIHSISDGPETGVVMTPSNARYWRRRYVSARRVLPDEISSSPAADGKDQQIGPIPPVTAKSDEPSPWDDFDGILRGDFEAWKQADDEAFEAYQKKNG